MTRDIQRQTLPRAVICSVIHGFVTATILVRTLSVPALAVADETNEPSADKELRDRWFATYEEIHKSLEVTIDDGMNGPKTLASTMILTLHHPMGLKGGLQHGRAYVWTEDGKPAVVECLWSAPGRQRPEIRDVCYEFHSLSQQPVMVEKSGERVWRCEQPGIQWQKHRGPEVPASSRTARLVQMRQIARSYRAEGRPGGHRLLPQPLFRYPEEAAGVIDGALFAFTQHNQPQVFLLMEARDEQWSVAFARSNILPRHVTYQDEIVWAVEQTRGNWDRIIRSNSEPFFIHYARERRRADNPDAVLSGGLR